MLWFHCVGQSWNIWKLVKKREILLFLKKAHSKKIITSSLHQKVLVERSKSSKYGAKFKRDPLCLVGVGDFFETTSLGVSKLSQMIKTMTHFHWHFFPWCTAPNHSTQKVMALVSSQEIWKESGHGFRTISAPRHLCNILILYVLHFLAMRCQGVVKGAGYCPEGSST